MYSKGVSAARLRRVCLCVSVSERTSSTLYLTRKPVATALEGVVVARTPVEVRVEGVNMLDSSNTHVSSESTLILGSFSRDHYSGESSIFMPWSCPNFKIAAR